MNQNLLLITTKKRGLEFRCNVTPDKRVQLDFGQENKNEHSYCNEKGGMAITIGLHRSF